MILSRNFMPLVQGIYDNWQCQNKGSLVEKRLPIQQLVTFDRSVMTYKITNRLCPENLWNKFQRRSHYSRYNTRFCNNLQIPKYNLEYSNKRFSYTALKAWNEVPMNIRELPTLPQFKKHRKDYLTSWNLTQTRPLVRSA